LFVLGGFGGCARAVAAAMRGERPVELTLDYQVAADPAYAELVAEGPALGLTVDYDELLRTFEQAGARGSGNGLGDEENATLRQTVDVEQMVALVLSGLRSVARR
ncbi:MAG: TIR domain-containing protein, partial [Actinomycetota bacterium]|nr:TIR domain-containing protein [Actinomycetota bacterium]